jgi:hypothetical protein
MLRRFFIGLSVMLLCGLSVGLIMCGVGALELTKKIEFLVFVIPTSWVAFLNCWFLIKVKC